MKKKDKEIQSQSPRNRVLVSLFSQGGHMQRLIESQSPRNRVLVSLL